MRVWRFLVGLVLSPLMALAGAGVGWWLSVRWAFTGRSRLPDAWKTTATGGPTPEEVNVEVAQMIARARKAAEN